MFDFDVERCGVAAKLKIIAAIEEPAVIERILTHLGLSAQPPPRTPARRTVSGRLIVEFGALLPCADG